MKDGVLASARTPTTAPAVAWAVAVLVLAGISDPVPLARGLAAVRMMASAAGAPSPAAVGAVAWGIMVWAALQLGCLGAGRAAGRWLGMRATRAGLGSVAVLLLGWLGAGLALLGFGVLGLFRFAVLAPLALFAVAALLDTARARVETPGGSAGAETRHWTLRAIRWISGAVVAAIAVSLLAPETHIDALTYHLGIAGRAVRLGKLFAPSGNFLHHFPLLTELLRGWGLGLGGEPAARLWTLGGLVAGAAAVRAAVAPLAGAAWGWAGFGLWATASLAAGTALAGKPDVFLAPFAIVAVALLARGGMAGALTAGLLAGAAAGAKLQGLVVVAVLVVLAAVTGGVRRRLAVALVIAGALSAAGPWLAKSALLTGDPVYPFGRAGWGMPAAAVSQLAEVTGTMALRGRYDGFLRRLAAPWTATMQDGLPAFLLALGPVALLAGGRAAVPWWIAGLLGWTAWLLGPPQPRYAMAPLAWLTVAIVAGLAAARARRTARVPGGVVVLAGACLVLQAAWTLTACAADGSWAAGLGCEAPEAFRRRALSTYAGTVERLASLPPRARVMYAGEWRSWPAPRDLVVQSLHEPMPAWPLIRASRDPEALARRWRQLGVTHVVHDPAAALYHRNSQTIFPWTARDLAVWAGFWRRHARLVAIPDRVDPQEGGYYLYALDFAGGPPRATPTLPGVEGVFAVVEGHLRRGDLAAAGAGARALEGIVGDIAEVQYFLGGVWHSDDPEAERRLLERADAGGYRDLLLWAELARLAEARGRPAEAIAWRRRAELR